MIAIAGTIGTGLFLGSGASLVNGGPVGFFLGYTIVGCLVGMMMYCLGEMYGSRMLRAYFRNYFTNNDLGQSMHPT
jgi:amino acid permease